MSRQEDEALAAKGIAAMEAFGRLTPAEKVARLKKIGILSPDGHLSERYGGQGPASPQFVKTNKRA